MGIKIFFTDKIFKKFFSDRRYVSKIQGELLLKYKFLTSIDFINIEKHYSWGARKNG